MKHTFINAERLPNVLPSFSTKILLRYIGFSIEGHSVGSERLILPFQRKVTEDKWI